MIGMGSSAEIVWSEVLCLVTWIHFVCLIAAFQEMSSENDNERTPILGQQESMVKFMK